mmetsp:Transcript_19373/g.30279  ORF Transcript_19373/g.30279 Transcript_19373/m.30279 type:complete len:392 (+) Transcript_19373:339-1514(+)
MADLAHLEKITIDNLILNSYILNRSKNSKLFFPNFEKRNKKTKDKKKPTVYNKLLNDGILLRKESLYLLIRKENSIARKISKFCYNVNLISQLLFPLDLKASLSQIGRSFSSLNKLEIKDVDSAIFSGKCGHEKIGNFFKENIFFASSSKDTLIKLLTKKLENFSTYLDFLEKQCPDVENNQIGTILQNFGKVSFHLIQDINYQISTRDHFIKSIEYRNQVLESHWGSYLKKLLFSLYDQRQPSDFYLNFASIQIPANFFFILTLGNIYINLIKRFWKIIGPSFEKKIINNKSINFRILENNLSIGFIFLSTDKRGYLWKKLSTHPLFICPILKDGSSFQGVHLNCGHLISEEAFYNYNSTFFTVVERRIKYTCPYCKNESYSIRNRINIF